MSKRPLGVDPPGGDPPHGYAYAATAPPTPPAWDLPREIDEEGLSMWAEDPNPIGRRGAWIGHVSGCGIHVTATRDYKQRRQSTKT